MRLDLSINHFNPKNDTWIREVNQRTRINSILQISFLDSDKLEIILENHKLYKDSFGGFYRVTNLNQVKVFNPNRHLEPIKEYLVSFKNLKIKLDKFNWKLTKYNYQTKIYSPDDCFIYTEWIRVK